MRGKMQQGEKERAREKENRVRDGMLQKKGLALFINLTVGQILRSSMTDNPMGTNKS